MRGGFCFARLGIATRFRVQTGQLPQENFAVLPASDEPYAAGVLKRDLRRGYAIYILVRGMRLRCGQVKGRGEFFVGTVGYFFGDLEDAQLVWCSRVDAAFRVFRCCSDGQ